MFISPQVIGYDLSQEMIGDSIVNIKALYALSVLYPESKIIVFCDERVRNIFRNYGFISEFIIIPNMRGHSDVLSNKKIRHLFGALSKRRLDILLIPFARSFKIIVARLVRIPKIIVFVRRKFLVLFSKQFVMPTGYKNLSGHASGWGLAFVRQINPEYYDKAISKIDFSQCRLQTSDSNKEVVESFLKSCAMRGGGVL